MKSEAIAMPLSRADYPASAMDSSDCYSARILVQSCPAEWLHLDGWKALSMKTFTRKWLSLAVIGIVLNVVFFMAGPFLDLTEAMVPDEPFDVKPAVSFEEATERFQALKPEAAKLYKSHLAWDVPYFLSMGLASVSLLMLAWGPDRRTSTYCMVLVFTLGFVIFDAAENLTIWTWFRGDGPTPTTANFVSFATKAKFVSLALTVPVLFAGLWQRFKNRSNTAKATVRA
ncbi:MAG: hypothetical protein AB8G99_24395 [Planctomycetaceae bacterium]